MRIWKVPGGAGCILHVEELGDADAPPILFLHGFNQCRLAWRRQFGSDLAERHRLVRVDLRGHGLSDQPTDSYGDSRLWADDVALVLRELGLARPVIVAWSYAGVVALDYLRHHGTANVSGVNFVAAVSKVGRPLAGFLGKDFKSLVPGFYSVDTDESEATLSEFVARCFDRPLPPGELEEVLSYNRLVRPDTRRGLFARLIDNDDLLARLDLPVLLSHGECDKIVLPSMAAHHAELIPKARMSIYRGIGHSPFYENAERFNAELAAFTRAACG